MDEEMIRISDFHKLAVLDTLKIRFVRAERAGRYYEVFRMEDVGNVLTDYDSGNLGLPIRDFVAALGRVKTRIFESERAENGAEYATHPTR
jgi:hypothetical protein